MYLGRSFSEIQDNIKPLFSIADEDMVIVKIGRLFWLLTLVRARYYKHHVFRVTPAHLKGGFSDVEWAQIRERVEGLKS